MGVELERKFLVANGGWRELAVTSVRIRQAYLNKDGKASIRVRILDDRRATLTIKSREPSLRRLEIEWPLSLEDAELLFSLRTGAVVEKTRYIVPCGDGDLKWEVDVFAGDNRGLAIAELELPDQDVEVTRPPWIGPEITQEAQYHNSALAQRPFARW